jgi:hypothetical protein
VSDEAAKLAKAGRLDRAESMESDAQGSIAEELAKIYDIEFLLDPAEETSK